jgi:hypothetical protein
MITFEKQGNLLPTWCFQDQISALHGALLLLGIPALGVSPSPKSPTGWTTLDTTLWTDEQHYMFCNAETGVAFLSNNIQGSLHFLQLLPTVTIKNK